MRKHGPAKGAIYRKTFEKRAVQAGMREQIIRIVEEHAEEMIHSQIAKSKGIKFLVARDPQTGKFRRVTAEQAKKLRATDVHEIWDKEPSTPAFEALMDRAIDKPTEHVEMTGAEGGPMAVTLLDKIQKARARLAKP